jgi:two-component system sensor histidine kinase KdpD
VTKSVHSRPEKFLACISSNEKIAKAVIRKTARLASYYNSRWTVLYVQLPKENADKIALDKQRFLINNLNFAQEMGAKVVKKSGQNISETILEYVQENKITTVCIGKPHLNFFQHIFHLNWFHNFVNKMMNEKVDIIILS